MYEVWYREAPHRDWRKLDVEYERAAYAAVSSRAVVATLKAQGNHFAQAEVREVREVEAPDGSDPNDIWQDVYSETPAVEVGHGETPPEGYGGIERFPPFTQR